MTTTKTLPILSALLTDLTEMAEGWKPHPKASKEGDRRVLGFAREECRAAEAVIRAARCAEIHRGSHVIDGTPRTHAAWMRAVERYQRAATRLDKLTRSPR